MTRLRLPDPDFLALLPFLALGFAVALYRVIADVLRHLS
jgi:hypothetical protein